MHVSCFACFFYQLLYCTIITAPSCMLFNPDMEENLYITATIGGIILSICGIILPE